MISQRDASRDEDETHEMSEDQDGEKAVESKREKAEQKETEKAVAWKPKKERIERNKERAIRGRYGPNAE